MYYAGDTTAAQQSGTTAAQSADEASDVFLKFIVVFGPDEVLPAFNGEQHMDVDCV